MGLLQEYSAHCMARHWILILALASLSYQAEGSYKWPTPWKALSWTDDPGGSNNIWRNMDDRLERRRELLVPEGALEGAWGEENDFPRLILPKMDNVGKGVYRTAGVGKRRARNSYSSYRKAVGKRGGSTSYSSYRKSVGKRNMLGSHDLNDYYWWLQQNT